MAYSLRDGWSTHGTSIDEFREELKDLDGRTYFIEVNSSELTWFTKQDSFPGAEPDKIYFTTWKECQFLIGTVPTNPHAIVDS